MLPLPWYHGTIQGASRTKMSSSWASRLKWLKRLKRLKLKK